MGMAAAAGAMKACARSAELLLFRPQVSLPLATVDGCPVGLSLLGPRGSDEALLLLSEQLMAALRPGYCGAA